MRDDNSSAAQDELARIKAEIVELLSVAHPTAEHAARFRALGVQRAALQAKDVVPYGR